MPETRTFDRIVDLSEFKRPDLYSMFRAKPFDDLGDEVVMEAEINDFVFEPGNSPHGSFTITLGYNQLYPDGRIAGFFSLNVSDLVPIELHFNVTLLNGSGDALIPPRNETLTLDKDLVIWDRLFELGNLDKKIAQGAKKVNVSVEAIIGK